MRISETFSFHHLIVRQMLNLDHETVLRLRKAFGLLNCAKERVGQTQDIAHRTTDSQVVLSIQVHLLFERVEKIHGVLGVHVDDVIGGGNEIFDRIMTTVRKEFDFGSMGCWQFSVQGSSDAKWRNCVRHGTVQA